MYRFKVFRFDHIRPYPGIPVQCHGNVANQVLDKFGIVVGALGHILFVRPLQQAVNLAGGAAFGNGNQLLDGHNALESGLNGDMRALVVGAVSGDFLRAGTEAGSRYHHLHRECIASGFRHRAAPAHVAIKQAFDTRDWRGFLDEIRETHVNRTCLCTQPIQHIEHHAPVSGRIQRIGLQFQQLKEARHMGAFVAGGQTHCQRQRGNGRHGFAARVDGQRIPNTLDPDIVDAEIAVVDLRLNIRNFRKAQCFTCTHVHPFGAVRPRPRGEARRIIPDWLLCCPCDDGEPVAGW